MKPLTILIPFVLFSYYFPNENNNEKTPSNHFISKKCEDISAKDIQAFNLDEKVLSESEYIYSCWDEIYVPEKTFDAPSGYAFDNNGNLGIYGTGNYWEDSYTEPGGYVTLTTSAYQVDIYDNHPVYYISSYAIINKWFIFEQNDNLIIRQGDNAVFYSYKDCKGTKRETLIRDPSWVRETFLTPQFGRGDGVIYEFPYRSGLGASSRDTRTKTEIFGDYYLVATDTTSVQSVYVHNQTPFVSSLSFNFGPVGFDIDFGLSFTAPYYATPITLPSAIII